MESVFRPSSFADTGQQLLEVLVCLKVNNSLLLILVVSCTNSVGRELLLDEDTIHIETLILWMSGCSLVLAMVRFAWLKAEIPYRCRSVSYIIGSCGITNHIILTTCCLNLTYCRYQAMC